MSALNYSITSFVSNLFCCCCCSRLRLRLLPLPLPTHSLSQFQIQAQNLGLELAVATTGFHSHPIPAAAAAAVFSLPLSKLRSKKGGSKFSSVQFSWLAGWLAVEEKVFAQKIRRLVRLEAREMKDMPGTRRTSTS